MLEQLLLAGFKHLEVTNFGNPRGMPQFSDADQLFKKIRSSKKVAHLIEDACLTAVTIRERSVERAIQAKLEGYGPDRILLMVSTSESHHFKNSGLTLNDYWKMAETYIKKAHDAGIKVNGTVSTIWGCPIEGPTDLNKAIDYTKRWFDIGADDVEHADHDGSAYQIASMVLCYAARKKRNTSKDCSPHTTRGWGLANVLAALQAGMTHYESTMGGIGGQPANFVDGIPVAGTGSYYYKDPNLVGLVSTEDMAVMMDEMGIQTNLDIDKILEIGTMNERIVGRRLRSESIKNGRIPKSLTGR